MSAPLLLSNKRSRSIRISPWRGRGSPKVRQKREDRSALFRSSFADSSCARHSDFVIFPANSCFVLANLYIRGDESPGLRSMVAPCSDNNGLRHWGDSSSGG